MKIAVIGAGSTYTPELISGLIKRADQLPLTECCLMDIDPHRLEIVGGFARRMVEAHGSPFAITLTTSRREAISNAAYIVTQIRVGQMQARRADEYLGQRHGLIGQETTGVGGMANALRTIPVILDVAQDVRKWAAEGALLVNFTNPAGLVTQALSDYASDVASVGVCNVPITAKMDILNRLGKHFPAPLDPARTELKTLGLNHLTWHYGFTLDGEDLWPQVMGSYLDELKAQADPEWEPRTIEVLGMIPNYYLHYYYTPDHKLLEQQHWPPSRAEEVVEIERDLLAQYANPALNEPPANLMKRGGAYYSMVATQLINAHYNNLGETHIVNVRHDGAVPGWPGDWVLEMPCRIDHAGIHPLPQEPLPPACFGLLAQVKAYELLTVEAAVHGDRRAAYQALLAHPLGPKGGQIQEVLDDMLETHRAHLPAFWS